MRLISPDQIRHHFSLKMADMFRDEVPAYGTLVELVADVNEMALKQDPDLSRELEKTDGLYRITEERHGAIRVGTAEELYTLRRLFAVMGMQPVGYYDLSVAGIPVHSTCFRPVDRPALAQNPFRIFTSLLRLDLIEDETLREEAAAILATRQIFTDTALELIDQAEKAGGLTEDGAKTFVDEALETFRWHAHARLDQALFARLLSAHRLIADVVSFQGPHINHLTPRTLDIDAVQQVMPKRGITPKAVIEGPPARKCPILLRQTAFKALSEPVLFAGEEGKWVEGHHTARFGEIEQRGAALTQKGRDLYDQLLTKVRAEILPDPNGENAADYKATLSRIFAAFPDDWAEIRAQDLAYFQYYVTDKGQSDVSHHSGKSLEELIEAGLVAYAPIVYEDFLPVSAAGIFQSNLGDDKGQDFSLNPNQALFEQALGSSVLDEFGHYETLQKGSIEACLSQFNAKAVA